MYGRRKKRKRKSKSVTKYVSKIIKTESPDTLNISFVYNGVDDGQWRNFVNGGKQVKFTKRLN